MDKNKLLTIVSLWILAIVFTVGFVCFIDRDRKVCDTVVEMKDGTAYNCAEANSYESGVTFIRGCDGSRVTVPTADIKTIKPVK